MNRYICGFVCFVVVACAVHAVDKVLTDEVVQSYVEAFERYQVKFNKHYNTKEDYEKHLRAYAASMEKVKELNEKFAADGVVFGETSRSDLLKEEKGAPAEETPFDPAKRPGRAYNANTFPQPIKAVELGHTANNVCNIILYSSHLTVPMHVNLLCFFNVNNRFPPSSTGSMFLV